MTGQQSARDPRMVRLHAIADRQLANMYYAGPAPFGRTEAGVQRWIGLRGALRLVLIRRGVDAVPVAFEELVDITAAVVALTSNADLE